MVFDILAATVLSLLGAFSWALVFGARRNARRLRREDPAAAADLRSGPVWSLAVVGLLFWLLAAAAIAIPQWIDQRAGL